MDAAPRHTEWERIAEVVSLTVDGPELDIVELRQWGLVGNVLQLTEKASERARSGDIIRPQGR